MEQVQEMLLNMWMSTKLMVPKVLVAIAIIIGGYILAKIVSSIIYKVLNKIKINRLAEKLNDIEFIRKSAFEIKFDKILSKIVYYIILLITFMSLSTYLNISAITDLISDIIAYIPFLFSGVMILVLGLLVANFLKNIIETTLKSMSIPSAKMIANAVFYFVFISVLMSALTQAHIDISILNANLSIIIAGAALTFAIGYGFAAKDVFSNHLTSIAIKDKYSVGDVIQINDVKGEIILLDTNSVVIKGAEGDYSFPLKVLTQEKIIIFKS